MPKTSFIGLFIWDSAWTDNTIAMSAISGNALGDYLLAAGIPRIELKCEGAPSVLVA